MNSFIKFVRSTLSFLALILLLLCSCERRPLEVEINEGSDENVRVRLVVDWRTNYVELYKEQPYGMTILLYGSNSTSPRIERSANPDEAILRLPPDTYRLIVFNTNYFYNEAGRDFTTMGFRDATSYDDIRAQAEYYTTRQWDDNVTYMRAPEPIGVALDTFEITPDQARRDTTLFVFYEDYLRDGPGSFTTKNGYYEIPELAWPMTVNLYVKAKVKRRQSIKSIEANISGLANGFYLSRVNRTTETGTLKLTDWSLAKFGSDTDSMGIITSQITSFGLPYGKELLAQRDSADNILSFFITLTTDSIQQCSFKVGKDIRYLTPEGREAQIRYRQDLHNLQLEIDLSDVIVLPPTPNTRSGAGFDAKVDDWEEGGTFEFGGF